jgi:hypothetical protein
MPCLAPPGPSSQFVCTCTACRRATYAPGVTEWPDRLSRCQSPVRLTGPATGLGTCSVLSNSTRVTRRMLLPNVCSVVDPGDQLQGPGQGASGRHPNPPRSLSEGYLGVVQPSRRGSTYLGVDRPTSAWLDLPRRGSVYVACHKPKSSSANARKRWARRETQRRSYRPGASLLPARAEDRRAGR